MATEKEGNEKVRVPRWLAAVAGFLLATAITSAVAWAVNTDTTQRSLLTRVGRCEERDTHYSKQLDQILEAINHLRRALENR